MNPTYRTSPPTCGAAFSVVDVISHKSSIIDYTYTIRGKTYTIRGIGYRVIATPMKTVFGTIYTYQSFFTIGFPSKQFLSNVSLNLNGTPWVTLTNFCK